ncbi:MAG: hypothetical protein JOZ55_09160, partial [Alphaproteobacteria bacterium]|nr:hypothetical protein [Alphaproteobacteria bacterium]
MAVSLAFAPYLSPAAFWLSSAIAFALTTWALLARARAAWARGLAFATL